MATVHIILLKARKVKENKHPICIRFTSGDYQYYIRIGLACHPNEWDAENSRFNRNYEDSMTRKEHNYILKKYELTSEKILIDNPDISYEQFKNELRGSVKKITVKTFFEDRILALEKTGKIGNAEVYKTTLSAINKFKNLNYINFKDINRTFLRKLQEYLLEKNCTGNTISVYMRTLRAVYNEAIKEGSAKNEDYPFKSRINPNGYSISSVEEKTSKRAISKADILKIKNFESKEKNIIDARNFFMFSYYTMGMNFSDLAYLKKENIVDDRLNYRRKKNGRLYSIKLLPQALDIIKFYNGIASDYIFPIINDEIHVTPFQKKTRIKTALKKFNRDIKKIGETVGIKAKLTTYVARHSWATILRKEGISVSIISQGLGHQDEKTTQIYLDSFGNEELDKVNQSII